MNWTVVALAVGVWLVGFRVGRLTRSPKDSSPENAAPKEIVETKADVVRSEVLTSAPTLQDVLNVLPVGIIVVDTSGVEVARNKTAEAVTGLRHLDLLIEDAAETLLTSARQGAFGSQALNLFGPPSRSIELSSFPLADGAMVAIEDTTEKVRLDQVRTDFVANISHELKTPVGAISVLAETLEGEVTDALAHKLAGRIVSEAQRMSTTINDLMELSRIEKTGERVTGAVDVVEVVSDSVHRVQALAERAGIQIDLSTPETPQMIEGDFRQLVSAVGNVVDNAVKYSDSGSTVHVSVFKSGNSVIIKVEDHGIGISAEHLDRIFERFYRADRARSRDTGGTGLGLSIVRNIVTQHGGQVNVESLEGKGSTFTLVFPLKSGEASAKIEVNGHVINQ